MKRNRVLLSAWLLFRAMLRRRITLLLLAVIPAAFLGTVYLTTSERLMPFKIASVDSEAALEVSEQYISLLFFAVASVGFLCSFLALTLIQQHTETNRRLVICGYHPVELICGNLLVLFVFLLLISLYVGSALPFFFKPDHSTWVLTGLLLAGFVYGCYGLLVGSLVRGELEGILLIVLLANLDAGWLQNPLFYAEAQNQAIIRYLPAYFPSQVTIISAFSDHSIRHAVAGSLLYGSLFLLAGTGVFYWKMKIKR